MKNILKDLCYGVAEPFVDYRKMSEEHTALREKHRERYDGFTEKLRAIDEELKQEFFALYEDLFAEIPFETEEAFESGFCAGVWLMIEVIKRGK